MTQPPRSVPRIASSRLAQAFAVALVAAGCTIATTPATPPIPAGMTAACKGGALVFAPGFKPARPVDFVGFRRETTEPRAVPGSTTGQQEAAWTAVITTDSVGNPCSGASDVTACLRRFDALRALGDQCQGFPIVPKDAAFAKPGAAAPQPTGNCSLEALLYTRGDEIGVIRTFEEARAFFGVIDAPEEALYLVRLGGDGLSCGEGAPAAYRELPATSGGGYEVQSTAFGACGGLVSRKILRVSPAGAITVVSQSTFVDCSR
jgi:hypothetical protein